MSKHRQIPPIPIWFLVYSQIYRRMIKECIYFIVGFLAILAKSS
jgi:hypothetical protein